MKKVKNLLLKVELEGNGVVNYDSNDQKWVLKKTHLAAYHDNVSFAKKVFTKNTNSEDKNDVDYKLKISHDCIGHDMFKYDQISLVPNIVHHDALLYSNIASPASIIRGYMFANKKETLKRTGAFTLCDAVQTCNAKSVLEVCSRAGEKTSNDGDTDKGDNTFFYKETVGDIKYETIGDIDLMKLQFISCDSMFDRYSFNPDLYHLYKEFLKKRMPSFNSELGYYQLKNSIIQIPEYGVLLSNEDVVFLTKETLKRLINVNIKRKGSYARIKSLKVKLVNDPLVDTFENENDWISLKTTSDIDNLNFDVEYFYEATSLNIGESFRKEFEEKVEEAKRKEKEAKKASKKSKKDELTENTATNE